MPVLDLDGRALSWREAGHGAPAILFHCSLAHSGALSGLMAGLGDRLKMRAPDLPGHGGTGLDPAGRIATRRSRMRGGCCPPPARRI